MVSKEIEPQKWYSADFTERSLALNTGTELPPNYNTNINWFEENILLINNKCIDFLIKNNCYKEIVQYISALIKTLPNWIKFGDINILLEHIKDLSFKIQNLVLNSEVKESVYISNALEMLCYLYKQCILIFREYIININLKEIEKLYNTKFTDVNFQKTNNKIFNCSEIYAVYKNLKNEFEIEKKLITPLWFVKQRISKLYINEINNILKVIEQLYSLNLKLEKIFFENNNYVCSASFIINENEMHNKIMFLSEEIKDIIENIMQNNIEKDYKLPSSHLEDFVNSIDVVHQTKIPDLWANHSKIWVCRITTDKRDVFGFCYNNLCEYIFKCIINFDFENFSKLYKTLFALAIISEIEINENLKDKELHSNIKFQYQISGLNILFKISGYAILVGDILKDKKWKEHIDSTLEDIMMKTPEEKTKNIEQLKRWCSIIDFIVNGFPFMSLIDVSNMERRFSDAIETSNKLEFENVGPSGHKKVVNSTNLEQLYYDKMGGFSQDMREIYAIATLNKYLPPNNKYKTRNLKIKEWKDLNEKENEKL